MNTQTLTAMNNCFRVAIIIILIVVLSNSALAFSYEADEVVIPWGTAHGQAYTDYFEFDWSLLGINFPYYTIAWDIYESTAYILDWVPGTSEGSLIQYNFDTSQLLEESIGVISLPEGIKVLATQDEYFIVESTSVDYICFDYDYTKLWEFDRPKEGEYFSSVSDLYKLNGGLWGVVMEGYVPPLSSELWKLSTLGEIIARVHVQTPTEDSYVIDISPEGAVTWSPFVDMFGGVYTQNNEGNFERQEDGQIWEFTTCQSPEFFLFGSTDFKPSYDGTVYTREYTLEGIRIKRYTYVPGLIPPVADFAFYPGQGPAPLSVTFQNYSCDEDGEIVRIDCDWDGDQQIDEWKTGNPSEFYHTFNDAGYINFILTVVDNDNLTDSWSGSVYVEPPGD